MSLSPSRIATCLHSTTNYDLNLAILIHCEGGNLHRLHWMRECGVFNLQSHRIHLTLIGSPGDHDYVDQLLVEWGDNVDVTFLEMPSKYPIPKINGYYLWLQQSGLQARWHGRVDDDSITDIAAAVTSLDLRYRDTAVHVATTPILWREDDRLFTAYLEEKRIKLSSSYTEFESSFTSHRGMAEIFGNDAAMTMFVETGERFQGPGDRALALAAHIAGVPVVVNPESDSRFHPERLKTFGGDLYHIHYVPWHDPYKMGLVRALTAKSRRPLEGQHETGLSEWLAHPAYFQEAPAFIALLTLLPAGGVAGGDSWNVAAWAWHRGTLRLLSKDQAILAVFDSFSELSPEVVLYGYGVLTGKPLILRFQMDVHPRSQTSGENPSGIGDSTPPLLPGRYHYCRLGHDRRDLILGPGGTIPWGAKSCEIRWESSSANGDLSLWGERGLTCTFQLSHDGIWRGNWLIGERMPVCLIPIEALA